MNRLLYIILFVSSVALTACHSGAKPQWQDGGDSLHYDYARLLTTVDYGKYRVVKIADPWHEGRTLHTYVLVGDSTVDHLPEGTVIHVPVRRCVCFTTVHAALLADLGVAECLKAMADVEYVKRADLRSLLQDGRIGNVGSGMSPDIEKIIDIDADVVMVSPFENSGGYGKLDEVNIPIVECADYMESSPLARAEWMKFYGMLTGREAEADSLFDVVKRQYLATAAEGRAVKQRPRVMMDMPSGSVWYVPGGRSTLGVMIADAGGDYVFADNSSGGSRAMSIEAVVERCETSDIWLYRYGGQEQTRETILRDHPAFGHIKAFKDGEMYGCSTERTTFYETTPFRPDCLLAELRDILAHRQANELTYFKKAK